MASLPAPVTIEVGEPPVPATLAATADSAALVNTIEISVTVHSNQAKNQKMIVPDNTLTRAAVHQLFMANLELEIVEGTGVLSAIEYRKVILSLLKTLRYPPNFVPDLVLPEL